MKNYHLGLLSLLLAASLLSCQGKVNQTVHASESISIQQPQSQVLTEAQIWMSDPLLKQYSKVLLSHPLPIDSQGAMGENQISGKPFRVGWQREGFKAIAYGLSAQDHSAIAKGIQAYAFAFRNQTSDGLFGKSSHPEIISFLGSYGRSLLILRDSGQREYKAQLEQYLPAVQRTINNPKMRQQESELRRMIPNVHETNQLIWAGLDYTLLYQITSAPQFKELAQLCLKTAINRQSEDGVFPEKGGSDTHYQAVSLEKLLLFSLYSRQFHLTQNYLSHGFNWLSQKIMANHTMNTQSNTRTGKQQELGPSKQFKEGRYGNPEAYIFWSYLGGRPSSRQRAKGFINRIFQEKFGCTLSKCSVNLSSSSHSLKRLVQTTS